MAAGRDPGTRRGGRLPALARRRQPARGPEPRQARAVRDLHDERPVATSPSRRAGFERELRDRIAAAWRAEEFHTAAGLIPDELLDAFMLCGTREGGRDRRPGIPRGGGAGPAAPPAGGPGEVAGRRAARRCRDLRARSAGRERRGADAGRSRRRQPAGGWHARTGRDDDRSPHPVGARATPGRRDLGDRAAVRLHGVGDPGRGGRGTGLGRRRVQPAALPGGPRRRGAAAHRHEHRQRDLRRPPRASTPSPRRERATPS